MEGFGSELSLTAIIVVAAKIARDFYVEFQAKKRALGVANGSNPGHLIGGSSTNLVLHVLDEHGTKLTDLGKDMTKVKVNLAKVNTKLDIKD